MPQMSTQPSSRATVYLIREETQCFFNEIGRALGNRDRSAVLRGYEKIALEINTSPQLRSDVIEIREGLPSKSQG